MKKTVVSHAAFGCATALLASAITYVALAGWPESISLQAHAQAPANTGTRQTELFKTTKPEEPDFRQKRKQNAVKGNYDVEFLADWNLPK